MLKVGSAVRRSMVRESTVLGWRALGTVALERVL